MPSNDFSEQDGLKYKTHTGGAIRLILTGMSGEPAAIPARSASFTASMPKYVHINLELLSSEQATNYFNKT
jgi:hypothetical protein